MECSKQKLLWYAWSKKEGIGYKETAKLLSYYGTIEAVFTVDKDEISAIEWLSDSAKEAILKGADLEEEYRLYEKMIAKDIHFVIQEEEKYPRRLLNMYDPPWFLYYAGELPKEDLPSIAIIGARACSAYGMEAARKLAKELAMNKVQVISGLAKGVDGYAHRGALEGEGKTFGVIGSGLNICYPRENYQLFHDVEMCGGILSEYPMGSPALAFHFPVRNRIIAGLSDGILVVEAKEKSGTLITVDCGLEQGKDIYALPGKITDVLSRGCNQLIQNGAKLIQSADDIIMELTERYPFLRAKKSSDQISILFENQVTSEEKMVLMKLGYEPIHFEKLLMDTGFDTAKLMEVMFHLQRKNLVQEVSSQYYVLQTLFLHS
ncbi:DNA-processing protein DprA [Anaerosporobacter sp.]|uniref:DNA-processing protein DprA n=1 Tax=Anaerosporobacter sp. TaxID=1872529 RepID=UPI00286F71EE|nr:DNA-processing protein DprA [Anaerosporobacter sp.]